MVIRDTLPATVTFVSPSNAACWGGQRGDLARIASLANGASVVRTVTVNAPAIGTLLNISASPSGDDRSQPEQQQRSLPAAPGDDDGQPTDVGDDQDRPGIGVIGSNISYAITVRNAAPVNASGVVVTDTLPAGLTFVSATGGGTASGNVVTWPAIATWQRGGPELHGTGDPGGRVMFTNIVASTAASGDLNPDNNNGLLPAARVTTVVAPGRRGDDQVGPGDGERRPGVTYNITVAEWSDGGGQRGGDRHAASHGDVRERHGWAARERQRGDLAGNSRSPTAPRGYTVTVTAPATVPCSTSGPSRRRPTRCRRTTMDRCPRAGSPQLCGTGRHGDHQDRSGLGERRGELFLRADE